MKRQEHTLNDKRHVSPQVLSTDCCGESTNDAATRPSFTVTSRGGEHPKIVQGYHFYRNFLGKTLKGDRFWPFLGPCRDLTPPPPHYPSYGVVGTTCECYFRRVTSQVDLTSWLDKQSLVKWFEDGPEARVTSQPDKRNLSSWLIKFHLCSNSSVGPWDYLE